MKRKKGWTLGIVVIAVIALPFAGYNLYRYPAMFRSLSESPPIVLISGAEAAQ